MSPIPGVVAAGHFAPGAVSIALMTNGINSSTTDQSAYTSGSSITPTSAGRTIIVAFGHSVASGSIGDATSITSSAFTGMTKLASVAHNTIASPLRKIEVWVGISTASAGTYTINLPNTPTGCRAYACEVTNGDSTRGTSGVIQTVTGVADSGGTASATLAAFTNGANATFLLVGTGTTNAFTQKAGFTMLNDGNYSTPSQEVAAAYLATPDTAPNATMTSAAWGAIALEVAAA